MSPAQRPKRTILPASFYLIASIALFVFLMVFFIDLVTVVADMVEIPTAWTDFGVFPAPILTERMIIAAFLTALVIVFFWSLDLLLTGRKQR